MSPLEINLDALEIRSPQLARLTSEAPGYPMELLQARSGAQSARTATAYLHSRYDPEAESRKAVAEALAQGAELLVCIGLGLGYQVRDALDAGANVLAIEADPAWLRSCLAARPLDGLLADPRLALLLCQDGEGILAALHELNPRSIAILENPALVAAFPEKVSEYRAALNRYLEKDRINMNTLKRFGKLWVRNIARNASCLDTYDGISRLEGRFTGLPAIVLAAGPSLDEVLPFLPAIRERCVLVCVDTALRSLQRHGIEPDFVLVVDPQYWNVRHLDRCAMKSSVLISEAAVWPSLFRMDFKACFLCSSVYPLGRYLEEKSGRAKGALGAGGSVATSAWDFARILGCSPIYMAGLDLSFPDGKTHARASIFEQRSLAAGHRLSPASLAGFEAMRGGKPYVSVANDGSPVVTDKRLSLYAWWFTRTTARYPLVATVNLSARGLKIDGMREGRVDEIMESPATRLAVDRIMAALFVPAPCEAPGNAVDSTLRALCEELTRLETLSAETIGHALSAKSLSGTALAACLKRLDEADARVQGSSARDVIGFLFPELAEVLGGRARTFDESLQKTMDIYERIRSSAAWHRDILQKSIGKP